VLVPEQELARLYAETDLKREQNNVMMRTLCLGMDALRLAKLKLEQYVLERGMVLVVFLVETGF